MILQILPLLIVIQAAALGADIDSSVIKPLSNGQFTTDIFDHVTKINELNRNNLIFSPASIHICLALTYFGAKYETGTEIADGLHFNTEDKNVIASQFENILQVTRGPFALMKVANKIYTNNLEIKPEFNAVAKKSFNSEAENLDFINVEQSVNTINNWVSEHTNDKIHNLVNSKIIKPETQMVLVNAIHFKGKWKIPLYVRDGTFLNNGTLNKKTLLMNDKSEYLYAHFNDLQSQVIKMPYNNSNLSMMIILPDEKTGLHQLEEKIKKLNLLDMGSKLKWEDVDITIPKFQIESEINMKEILKDMGIKRMFSDDAQFDFFTTSTASKVDDVIHKAFIDVNEYGTEAAGATGFAFDRISGDEYQKYFYADHPFFFAIVDEFNVYFTGHLINV